MQPNELQNALARLPHWQRNGSAIERGYAFANFVEAMAFVNKVAEAAEQSNHHPDITISYNKVALVLTSHDSGGVTARDIRMAAKIDEISSPHS